MLDGVWRKGSSDGIRFRHPPPAALIPEPANGIHWSATGEIEGAEPIFCLVFSSGQSVRPPLD